VVQKRLPEGGHIRPRGPIQLPRLAELVEVIALLAQAQAGQLLPQPRQEGILQKVAHHAIAKRLLADDQLIGVDVGNAGKGGDAARLVLIVRLQAAGYRSPRFLPAAAILNCGFFALRHFLKKEKHCTKLIEITSIITISYFDLTTTNCDVNSEKYHSMFQPPSVKQGAS
jgi:hypothetical protein